MFFFLSSSASSQSRVGGHLLLLGVRGPGGSPVWWDGRFCGLLRFSWIAERLFDFLKRNRAAGILT